MHCSFIFNKVKWLIGVFSVIQLVLFLKQALLLNGKSFIQCCIWSEVYPLVVNPTHALTHFLFFLCLISFTPLILTYSIVVILVSPSIFLQHVCYLGFLPVWFTSVSPLPKGLSEQMFVESMNKWVASNQATKSLVQEHGELCGVSALTWYPEVPKHFLLFQLQINWFCLELNSMHRWVGVSGNIL